MGLSEESKKDFDGKIQESEVEEVFETNWDLEVDKFDNMGLNE